MDVASPALLFSTSLGSQFDVLRLMLASDNTLSDFLVILTSKTTYIKNTISMNGAFYVSHTFTNLPAPGTV
jgi:hypothetical protein